MEALAVLAVIGVVAWAINERKAQANSSKRADANWRRAQNDLQETERLQDEANQRLQEERARDAARSYEAKRLPDIANNERLRAEGKRYVTDEQGRTIPLVPPIEDDPYYSDGQGGYGPPSPDAPNDPYNQRTDDDLAEELKRRGAIDLTGYEVEP